MKDTGEKQTPNPYLLLELAEKSGWQSVETIPLRGDGPFMALTLTGLEREVRNRSKTLRMRRADAWGPARCSVISVESGNYLAAIAWKPLPEASKDQWLM